MPLFNKSKLVLLALIGSTLICKAQAPSQALDLSGHWTGTSNWGLQQILMQVDLLQDGNLIEGTVYTETLEKTKSATYLLSGYIKADQVTLKGSKFIEKTGNWCLPTFTMAFSVDDGKEEIKGRWKNNNVKGGCWPGVTGKVELVKKTIKTNEANRAINIAENDSEGVALYENLDKRNYYALIIAEEEYMDPNIVELDFPIDDAQDLQSQLITNYSFEPQHITFLKNPDRTTIIEAFDNLTRTVKETDNVLIFYAGHGIWDSQIEQGYWLPVDAKKTSKAAWLSNGTIRDYIRAINSKHTLLITDACFSGGILKQREAFRESKAMLELYKLPSRRALTSGSLKTVPDKSVFIKYLIKSLEMNEQPLLSAEQLFSSFKYNVINNSPNGQVPQYGVIQQSDDEGGDFIFLRK